MSSSVDSSRISGGLTVAEMRAELRAQISDGISKELERAVGRIETTVRAEIQKQTRSVSFCPEPAEAAEYVPPHAETLDSPAVLRHRTKELSSLRRRASLTNMGQVEEVAPPTNGHSNGPSLNLQKGSEDNDNGWSRTISVSCADGKGEYVPLLATADIEGDEPDMDGFNVASAFVMASRRPPFENSEAPTSNSFSAHTRARDLINIANSVAADEDASVKKEKRVEDEAICMLTVNSGAFNFLSSFVIVINTISIGMETDFMAKQWTLDKPAGYREIDLCCLLWYTCELVFRFMAFGINMFSVPDWKWNVVDCVMVAGQLIEEVNRELTHENQAWFRIVRLMRVCRLFRLLRSNKLLVVGQELRMITMAIANTISPLVSAMFLLSMMAYCLGVYLTQVVTQWKVDNPDADGELLLRFGSLDRSMLSLYQAISNGMDWAQLETPLYENISPWLSLLLCMYVAFSLMALLNVITSIFLSTAIRAAEDDQKRGMETCMRDLFEACDEDCSGSISWGEFHEVLQSPDSEQFFKSVEMNPDDAMKLFRLMDTNQSGELSADELISGLKRMQGNAKAIDFASFQQDYECFVNTWLAHAENLESMIFRVEDSLCDLQKRGTVKASVQSRA